MNDEQHTGSDVGEVEGPPQLGGEGRTSYEPGDASAPRGPGLMLTTVGIVCLGLVAFGVIKSVFFSEAAPKDRPRVESIWSEQLATSRQALELAREAQALQRERMREMQQAMEDEVRYVEGQ